MTRTMESLQGRTKTLTLIKELEKVGGRRYFLASCYCGETIRVRSDCISTTVSCGCYQKKRVSETVKTHGLSNTPIYIVWQNMKDRCANTKNKQFSDYGGRGITVCDRWLSSFENFLEDMGSSYESTFDLDRIDNNENYSPSNCRWVDRTHGNHNKRKPSGGTSKYKGVYFDKNKKRYIARIYKYKQTLLLKSFVDEEEAAVAYDNFSENLYGDRPNGTVRQ